MFYSYHALCFVLYFQPAFGFLNKSSRRLWVLNWGANNFTAAWVGCLLLWNPFHEYTVMNTNTNLCFTSLPVVKVPQKTLLMDALKEETEIVYDFCMCNPPFFANQLEAKVRAFLLPSPFQRKSFLDDRNAARREWNSRSTGAHTSLCLFARE